MFLEVYAMKRSQCSSNQVISHEPKNLHFFDLNSMHIRQSNQFPGQAEIVASDTYVVAESYENLVDRISESEGALRVED